MVRDAIAVLVVLIATPAVTLAQDDRFYVGAALTLSTQTHGEDEPLGGTKPSGGAFAGVRLSPRLALEFEQSFTPRYSWEYSYHFSFSGIADVIASRRDDYYSFELRSRAGVFEPVAGVAYIHGNIARHAIAGGRPYFDDDASQHAVAAVGGLDLNARVGKHVDLIPTFRVLAATRRGTMKSLDYLVDPLRLQTSTGAFVLRYGIGVRMNF